MPNSRSLSTILDTLRLHYGDPKYPALDDPFQLILWVQVAYLADDLRRETAFRSLERRVGLSLEAILKAPRNIRTEVAAEGGDIGIDLRVDRMQKSAQRVISKWKGDLSAALDMGPVEAVRVLTRFPMIGKPGAKKILLQTRRYPMLALDSNGLRVLLRLGYGMEGTRYEKTYENVRKASAPEVRTDYDWLIALYWLSRQHGQVVCRRKQPQCSECPLTGECAYYAEHFGMT